LSPETVRTCDDQIDSRLKMTSRRTIPVKWFCCDTWGRRRWWSWIQQDILYKANQQLLTLTRLFYWKQPKGYGRRSKLQTRRIRMRATTDQ
jgi:hypothetical protein